MSLKSGLRYKEDFVIVSSNVWKFLKNKYGGGPEIELIPEARNENSETPNSLLITSDQEPCLEKNTVVSLDLIRVHILKDADPSTRYAKSISKTLPVSNLLVCLSNKFYFAFQNASLSYLGKEGKLIEVKDKSMTLAELEIQDGGLINVSQRGEHNLTDPLPPVHPKTTSNASQRYQYDDESSKTDDNNLSGVGNTVVRQVFEDSDGGGDNYTNPSREGSDKMSTEGTSNPRRNSFDYDPIFGDDEYGGMNFDFRPEIIHVTTEKHPDLNTFLEKAKLGIGKEKIVLNFKPLKEIKSNIKNLQHEWSLRSSNIFSKKI